MRKSSHKLIVMLWLLTACSTSPNERLPYFQTADFTPVWLADDERPDHRTGAFTLLDQDSAEITQDVYEGKIHVANFFFSTCPGICTRMTDNLKAVQDSFFLDQQLVILSFSVMPWVDSIPRLNKYAAMHHINADQWHLLTGDKEDIYTLARNSYFAEEPGVNNGGDDFIHSEHILLVDPDRHIRGVYNGTLPLEVKRMIEDIRLLKQEFGSNP